MQQAHHLQAVRGITTVLSWNLSAAICENMYRMSRSKPAAPGSNNEAVSLLVQDFLEMLGDGEACYSCGQLFSLLGDFLNPDTLQCLCVPGPNEKADISPLPSSQDQVLIQNRFVSQHEIGYLSRSIGTIPTCDGSASGLCAKNGRDMRNSEILNFSAMF